MTDTAKVGKLIESIFGDTTVPATTTVGRMLEIKAKCDEQIICMQQDGVDIHDCDPTDEMEY